MKKFFAGGPLGGIVEQVLAGRRISREDGIRLFNSHDLPTIGFLADQVRRRKVGEAAYYTTNANLNPTNVCYVGCSFCAFARQAKDPDAYVLRDDQIRAKVSDPAIREVHIVGGLHPDLDFEYFEGVVRTIRDARPDLYIKAFTAVEIDYFCNLADLSTEQVLLRLKAAGLNSLPGGGAEILVEPTRSTICEDKMSGARWLEVHETAHRLGIPTNATMLYGHVESAEDRVDHLLLLRELQDRTGGFEAYVPLAFHPANTPYEGVIPPTGGALDFKALAVGRILLDNFPHVKALWNYIGIKMAQAMLQCGVDDLAGTFVEENIVHAAGASTPQGMPQGELERLIREAGRVPVHCTSDYRDLAAVPA